MQICSANSLVGVTINELGLPGSEGLHLAISGKPKAKVLPDPVGALQQYLCLAEYLVSQLAELQMVQ